MLFFSELIGKDVYSEDQRWLGKLRDIRFLNADTPLVTKIVVERKTQRIEVPITALKQINSHITVKKIAAIPKPNKNELSASHRLLDKQIIDLVGNKVVRANDIILQDAPVLSISGIDIGFSGILRRLGIERPIRILTRYLHIDIPMTLLSWGDILNLELKDGQIKLRQQEERLSRIHEEDLADYLEMTTIKHADRFLKTLNIKKAAQVVENLTINYQVNLFQRFEPRKSAEIIMHISPDEAADILLALERPKRDKIMKLLTRDRQNTLHRLMTFSRTPVGKLMTSDFCAVESHMTVREILQTIRHTTTDYSALGAIYILNRDDQLVGVVSPHELMMQEFDMPAYKFMVPEPIVVLLTTSIEVVMNKLFKYKIPSLPVINREKHILGVVTIDDLSEYIIKKIQ